MRSVIICLRKLVFRSWLLGGLLVGVAPPPAPAQTRRQSATGPDGPVTVLTALPNGRVLVGGAFTHFDGRPRPGLARLLPDGRLDPTFMPTPLRPHSYPHVILVQPDGRLLVGGTYYAPTCPTCADEPGRGYLERRLPNGTPDPGFAWPFDQPAGSQGAGQVIDAALQIDGAILVSGSYFPAYSRPEGVSLVRLQPNGRLDSTFTLFRTEHSRVAGLARQADGRLLVTHDWLAGDTVPLLHRLTATGLPDPSFACVLGAPFPTPAFDATLPTYNVPEAIAFQPDGRILTGGEERVRPGAGLSRPVPGVVRLLPDGRLDPSFRVPRRGNYTRTTALLVLPDGRLLVSSVFDISLGGQAMQEDYKQYRAMPHRLRRHPQLRVPAYKLEAARQDEYHWVAQHGWLQCLRPDGSHDLGFQAARRPNGTVRTLARLPGGQVLVGGFFTTYDGHPAPYLVQLNADGTWAKPKQRHRP